MSPEQIVLAFDTSAAHCAAALLRGDTVLAARCEKMSKGQAERLMPLLQEMLAEVGLDWSDLTRIGVGVGPGNFTGIRIAVSAARGLALGLGIPAVGVNSFEIVRATEQCDFGYGEYAEGLHALAVVAAPGGAVHIQDLDGSIQSGHLFNDPPTCAYLDEDWRENVITLARIAAGKSPGPRPAPLYIRPADAAPSRDAPPVILNDT